MVQRIRYVPFLNNIHYYSNTSHHKFCCFFFPLSRILCASFIYTRKKKFFSFFLCSSITSHRAVHNIFPKEKFSNPVYVRRTTMTNWLWEIALYDNPWVMHHNSASANIKWYFYSDDVFLKGIEFAITVQQHATAIAVSINIHPPIRLGAFRTCVDTFIPHCSHSIHYDRLLFQPAVTPPPNSFLYFTKYFLWFRTAVNFNFKKSHLLLLRAI